MAVSWVRASTETAHQLASPPTSVIALTASLEQTAKQVQLLETTVTAVRAYNSPRDDFFRQLYQWVCLVEGGLVVRVVAIIKLVDEEW